MKIFRKFGVFAVAIATVGVLGASASMAAPKADDQCECRIGGVLLGPQAYSFNRFTFFEAIDKAKEVGCSVIEAYPGQKLSPENPVPFSHDAPPRVWAEAKCKLDEAGVRLVAYGVVGLGSNEDDDEDDYRRVFDFAKIMGIGVINSEPKKGSFKRLEDSLKLIEKLVKEYDIKVGIHNHPKRADNPDYKYWDPKYVLSCVQDLDPRIGSCADTGHWIRSGVKPIDGLKILEGRIVSSHLKDLNKFDREAHDVPYGQGVADMDAVMDELERQGFMGPVSIEYEHNWDNSVPEIAQCVEYMRKR